VPILSKGHIASLCPPYKCSRSESWKCDVVCNVAAVGKFCTENMLLRMYDRYSGMS
jgi:hypothetical protein